MAGDARLLLIRKPELCNAFLQGLFVFGLGISKREKAFQYGFFNLFSLQVGGNGSADQFAAFPHYGNSFRLCLSVEDDFLCVPAFMAECFPTVSAQRKFFLGKTRFNAPCKGKVNIVSSENQMISHSDSFKPRAAICLSQRDEGEVGGSAAYVTDENQFIRPDQFAPVVFVADEPVIECGQRFFQQCHIAQTGHGGGFHCQITGNLVKGCGNRNNKRLVLKIKIRLIPFCAVPRVFDMFQVSCGGLNRRNLEHLVSRTPGENSRSPVNIGMTQPAFCRRNQPGRHL